MYLSDKQIVSAINDYIVDKRYKQAILIDGDWGSGKTFFVQNILCPEIKKNLKNKKDYNRKVIYISLYGTETFQQIIDEIYTSLMEDFFDKKIGEGSGEVIGKGLNFISKVASVGLKHFDIEKDDLPKISELKKLKDAVLIFDDLERCNIDINQVFGFINNLVEHNNIKVIIVANQSEIGKLTLVRDLPQKYLVVLNENLELDNNCNTSTKNDEKKALKEESLKQYTEKLFSNDIVYEKVKEKLIGITIHYRVDLENVYPAIIQNYTTDEKTKIYLENKKDIVISMFQKKQHYNLRTMIFAIMSFEKFFIVLDKIDFQNEKYITDQKDRILEYCIFISIHLKLGKKPYLWSDRALKYGIVYLEDYFSHKESIYGYKFVDDYLQFRSFNNEMIKKIVLDIANEQKEKDDYKKSQASLKYMQLYKWWELEDDKINDYLNELQKELKQEKYPPIYFKDIIILLMQLEYNGFDSINYNNYVDDMKKYLEKNSDDANLQTLEILSSDNEVLEKYNNIITPLICVLKKKEKAKNLRINECFDDNNEWGANFNNYCTENKHNFSLERKFLFYLDTEKVVMKLKESNVKNLYGFLDGISSVYSFGNLCDFFKDDISNLNELIDKIDITHMANGKITRKIYFEKLKNKLEKSLTLIQKN